jgi:glycosyltransferase involved in cell wall biosynthesis
MRIAILNTFGIPARYGGTETCIEEVGTRLVRKGHDITVYCGRNDAQKYSSYRGISLINFERLSNKLLDFPFRSMLSTLDALGRKFDVLHYYGTDSAISMILPRALLRKLVLSLDGLPWNRSSYPTWLRSALKLSSWPALYLPQVTTVDSMYVREWYRNNCGRAPIYVPYGAKVMPHYADPDVLGKFALEADQYILFVGFLLPEKGVQYIIEAFNNIVTGIQLAVVGGNPYGSSYERMLRRIAGESVKFLGPVWGSDMENLYKGAYLYVNASETEGTSPGLLQAMGSGNCVLASDIPQNLETIGDAGLSFRNKSLDDLRRKIQLLLSNREIVEDYRKKAVDRVTRLYSWDSIADHVENLYMSLSDHPTTRNAQIG